LKWQPFGAAAALLLSDVFEKTDVAALEELLLTSLAAVLTSQLHAAPPELWRCLRKSWEALVEDFPGDLK
jgi:hypothetical protein